MKRVPLRMCVVCRTMKPKADLLKVVRNAEGAITVDPTGKLPGRGAYVCRQGDCAARLAKVRGLERAFHTGVPSEMIAMIEKELSE